MGIKYENDEKGCCIGNGDFTCKNTSKNYVKILTNIKSLCYNKKHIKSVYTLKGSYTANCKIWYTLFERLTYKGVLRDFLYEFFCFY